MTASDHRSPTIGSPAASRDEAADGRLSHTKRRRRRRRCAVALLLVAMLASAWAWREPLLIRTAEWLDVGQPPQRADYIMLLNGDENTRPFVAAAVVKQGFAPKVLIAEVAKKSPKGGLILPPMHEINRQVLIHRGIAPSDITILPASATTTRDEARALADFLKDRPDARVLVVTSDYHTRRSRWIFGKELGVQSRQLSFVSAPSDDFRLAHWWQDEAGFVAIGSEYLKLPFYLIRYGYFGYWVLACGGLAVVIKWIGLRKPYS